MATGKQNLSDLLRQEVKQDSKSTSDAGAKAKKVEVPKTTAKKTTEVPLSRMTKAQLLEHIKTLESKQPAPEVKPDPEAEKIAAKNAELAKQVETLESKLATHEKAIATADKTIKTLKSDSTAKTKLEKELKELEKKIATQEKAIATADKTIKTLKSDSTAKTKLEKELKEQKGLVEKLYAQVQELEAEAAQPEPEPAPIQRTVDEDRALVLARISSYQANLQFPAQPASSIPEEDIGWFD